MRRGFVWDLLAHVENTCTHGAVELQASQQVYVPECMELLLPLCDWLISNSAFHLLKWLASISLFLDFMNVSNSKLKVCP